ncbi:MAG: hypothetical protein CMD67_02480 [Gammaproteobacteria bacterium]|jgi:lysophospholipid acyltransferase (LPLAT)-like uncharacterized protein|nr:hypothetical protein [Gammaproteobacteria bacterium]|tara:strand:+ start:897 stop:1607 length:711 start_codon:yes stop_codon:yes gene_type:complete
MITIKKISNSNIGLNILSFLASTFIRIVASTSNFKTIGNETVLSNIRNHEPFIVAFWHGRLLMAPKGWPSEAPLMVMISHHKDGEIIARTAASFGIRSARGSTSKGGSAALRSMIKTLRAGGCVGITPDGPRGPRMRAQMGVISLAQISGVPIFPATYSVSRCKIINSWDRFIIALPFNRGIYLWDEPIFVPKNANAEVLETKRKLLENRLNILCEKADKMVGLSSINPDSRHKIH